MSGSSSYRPRWYRVHATLDQGRATAKIEVSLQADEYVGPFISLEADALRQQALVRQLERELRQRFPKEGLIRIDRMRPIADPPAKRA